MSRVSAPTLWEEGKSAGGLVAWLAAGGCAVVVVLDLVLFDHLSPLFDIGFVLLCIGAGLAVRPRDFFTVGVLPPFPLLAVLAVLAVARPGAIAGAGDGIGQALVAGLAHHSGALFAADVNVLVVIGIRIRVRSVRRDRAARRASPYAVHATTGVALGHPATRGYTEFQGYSNRDGSPAPIRTTSGTPEEKSTTVVGSEVVSPASRTASSF